MRHGTNRRQRNRSSNGGRRNNNNQPQRTQVYDSNGPDVRIRGTAYQVAEKYLSLAKDASAAGDRITAESYYQHAEHYIRIIGEFNGTFDVNRMSREIRDNFFGDEEGNSIETNQADQTAVAPKRDDLGLPASIIGQQRAQQNQIQTQKRQPEVVE